jgi:hypothetical protein
MTLPILNVLRIVKNSLSLFDQLCLEEALLRADIKNWLVISNVDIASTIELERKHSKYFSSPIIVLGVAGKLEKLVNIKLATERGVTVIRRFTGGGTVVVDTGTLFASFIINKCDARPIMPLFPREIMRWSADSMSIPLYLIVSLERENSHSVNMTTVGMTKRLVEMRKVFLEIDGYITQVFCGVLILKTWNYYKCQKSVQSIGEVDLTQSF